MNKLLLKLLIAGSCFSLAACSSDIGSSVEKGSQNEFVGRVEKQTRSLDREYEEYKTNASLSFKYIKNGETDYTYTNVNLRFGFMIDKDKLDADMDNWTAYGVLLMSKSQMSSRTYQTTLTAYLRANDVTYDYSNLTDSKLDTMHVNHESFTRQRWGILTPPPVVDEEGNIDPEGSFYGFNAYLPIDSSHYADKVYAVAFVAMNGTIKYLKETCESVSSLAFKHYKEDCNESNGYPLFDLASRDSDVTAVPWGTTEIPNNGYSGQSLKKVLIPSTVTKIGNYAFGATNLEDVAFGIGVVEIGQYAFHTFKNKVSKLVLPDSLEVIGNHGLGYFKCETLYIGKNVRSIISSGTSLTYSAQVDYIIVDPENTYYDSRNDCNCLIETATNKIIGGSSNSRIEDTIEAIGVLALSGAQFVNTEIVIPESVTTLESGCFAYTNITKLTIPGTIENFNGDAFHDCGSLEHVYIGDGIENLPHTTFEYCANLRYVRLPSTLISIGFRAFYNCSSLETLYIPSKVEQIDEHAFYGTSSLKAVYLPASLTSVSFSVNFNNMSSDAVLYVENETKPSYLSSVTKYIIVLGATRVVLTSAGSIIPTDKTTIISVEIEEGVTSVNSSAFSNASNLNYVSFSNSVTTVYNSAFSNCTSLKNVVLSESLRIIYNYGFSGSGLTEVVLPNTVTSLQPSAFRSCTSLSSVKLSTSLVTISKNCFRACTALTSIIIPISVTNTGEDLFRGCTSMTDIYCEVLDKPTGWHSNWAANCSATVTWGYKQ